MFKAPIQPGPRGFEKRQGMSLYVTVLAVSMIVSLLGLAGLNVVRLERHQAGASADMLTARANARSAVQLAMTHIKNDPNWRTTYTNGVETPPQTLGGNDQGTLSWILEDTDGDLASPDTSLRLKGVGRVNDVVQVTSVVISGAPAPLTSLQCATYSSGNVNQSSEITVNLAPVASGSTLTVGGTVFGDAEGNPIVYGEFGSVTGTATAPEEPRVMPAADVWNTYKDMATTIPYTSIPFSSLDDLTTREMEAVLLSGNINPYGPAAGPDGIYYIQVPPGFKLAVSETRFHCTLLIELIGSAEFDLKSSSLWDPFNGNNYPAAIVKGTGNGQFRLKPGDKDVMEAKSPKFNYNPPGDPYNGDSNTSMNDRYTPLMRGLFHIIGAGVDVDLSHVEIEGAVIAEGTMKLGSKLTLTHNPALFTTPPFGYVSSNADITPESGSWIWDSAP